MKDTLFLPIREIARLYRSKELSPVEVTRQVLQKSKEKNEDLNAFISIWEDKALESAKKCESIFLKNQHANMLTGIPFNIKDIFYTKGERTTCGSRILKDFIPDFTANIVDKLTQTNAILFAKANMLEFAYGIVHPDYGKCNNPWDLSRTAGGSSSGSASSVAAGIGFFSLGTDTGGSIRIPASYCGIAGIKPTYGLMDVNGVFPLSKSLDHAGPIARNVEDLEIVFNAMLEKEPGSFLLPQDHTSLTYYISKHKKRIGVLPDKFIDCIDDEVKKTYLHSLNILENLNFEIITVNIPGWENALDILLKILMPEAALVHINWLDRKNDYAPLTYSQIEKGMHIPAVDYLDSINNMQKFRNDVNQVFKNYELDSLMTPTVPYPAPKEDPSIEEGEINEGMYTAPFNVSGHPALTLNAGFSKDGLPIGMQFVGKWFEEIELLKIARIFELNLEAKDKRYPHI